MQKNVCGPQSKSSGFRPPNTLLTSSKTGVVTEKILCYFLELILYRHTQYIDHLYLKKYIKMFFFHNILLKNVS